MSVIQHKPKRALRWFLALALAAVLILMANVQAHAADPIYEISDGVLTVTSFGDSYPWHTNENYDNVTKIVIGNDITGIPSNYYDGQFAFRNFKNVREVVLPNTLTEIGTQAFIYCSALETITLPDGLVTIGNNAFQFCTALRSLEIPASVTSIGNNAFARCTSMTSITYGGHTLSVELATASENFGTAYLNPYNGSISPADATNFSFRAYPNPNSGYRFKSWSDGSTESNIFYMNYTQAEFAALTYSALTLNLEEIPPPNITVAAQSGALTYANTAAEASFAVSCENFSPVPTAYTVTWYADAAGETPLSAAPADLVFTPGAVSAGSVTYTAQWDSADLNAGNYYFRISSGEVKSDVATLSISPADTLTLSGTVKVLSTNTTEQRYDLTGVSDFPVNPGNLVWGDITASTTDVLVVAPALDGNDLKYTGKGAEDGTDQVSVYFTCTNYDGDNVIALSFIATPKIDVSDKITFNQDTKSYNGGSQAISAASVSGITAGSNAGWTYTYTGTDSTDYAATTTPPTNAGTYSVQAEYEDNDHYGTKTADYTIETAALVIKPSSHTITKGAELPTATVTYSSFQGEDSVAVITGDLPQDEEIMFYQADGITELVDTKTAGSYPIKFTEIYTLSANNYTITIEEGTLTVKNPSSGGGGGSTSVSGPILDGASGWDSVIAKTKDAETTDTLIIDMNGTTNLDSGLIDAIVGREVTVVLDMGNGMSWTLNGTDIPQGTEIAALNLSVSIGTNFVPAEARDIDGSIGEVQLRLSHNGELPFAMTLSVKLDEANAGNFANLYYYNEETGELEFQSAVKIAADGTTEFIFNHASDYLIVVAEKNFAPEPESPWQNPFTDVKPDAWFYSDMQYVVENGLFAGTSATTFSPNVAMTRAMLVTVLWRMEGSPIVEEAKMHANFADVVQDAYYENAVGWAAKNEIVSGYGEGFFGPDDNVTREQFATILYRYAQFKHIDVSVGEDTNILSYNDALELSEYAVAALQWACGEGVVTGKPGNLLDPKSSTTRAEAAAMLHRFLEQ